MKNIRLTAFVCASAVALCSCSVLGSLSDKFGKKKESQSVEKPVKSDPVDETIDVKNIINGEWTIESVGSTQIVRDEDVPYIYFDVAEVSFYASNGCNILNGVFSTAGNRVTFSNILSTMKYCSDVRFDTEINMVIAEGRTVVLNTDNVATEGLMIVEDESGRKLMTLRKHAMAFLNGEWRVDEINGQKTDSDEMTVFIDMFSLRIHGNTGCNFFNGDIRIEPGQTNGINFSGMGVTRRMCQNADLERRMLVALEECTTAVDRGDGVALLSDASGDSTIKLVRQANTRK